MRENMVTAENGDLQYVMLFIQLNITLDKNVCFFFKQVLHIIYLEYIYFVSKQANVHTNIFFLNVQEELEYERDKFLKKMFSHLSSVGQHTITGRFGWR